MLEGNALKEIFRKNLNGLLAESSHTQKELADYVGVTPASVNEWLKGRKQPRMNKIDMICNFFGVDRTALLGIPVTLTADTRREIVTPAKKFVPVVGSVRCGPGGPCYEDITEYLTVDANCPADEMIALRVEGDSMTPIEMLAARFYCGDGHFCLQYVCSLFDDVAEDFNALHNLAVFVNLKRFDGPVTSACLTVIVFFAVPYHAVGVDVLFIYSGDCVSAVFKLFTITITPVFNHHCQHPPF